MAFSHLLYAFLSVVALAACSKNTLAGLSCSPMCPQGAHCEAGTGCVPDNPVNIDMAIASIDGPSGCSPPCGAATPYCSPNLSCVACLQDQHCPAGQVCRTSGSQSLCVPGCSDDLRCNGGGAGPIKCCDGGCVDVATDASNCGTCGNTCGAQHASSVCNEGVCVPGTCDKGWGDCNQDKSDGCEANVQTDATNCGMCGTRCSIKNALAACAAGCYIAACNFGFDDCNGDAGDGCEVSVLSDPKHCGSCAKACPGVAHAKNACINAACQLTSCEQGFADCDKQPANGCEVNIFTDAANCGSCGARCDQGLVCQNGGCTCPQCNFAHATSKCINNVCILDRCVAGYTDCNNDTKDGCEIHTDADAVNCGSCGTICPMNLKYCAMASCTDKSPATVYSEMFTQGATPNQQCINWNAFRVALNMMGYSSITISGTQDMVGATCDGPGADLLCQALHNGGAVNVMCNGRSWSTGPCGGGTEISASGQACQCSNPAYVVRPCIGNLNWGGVNTTACNAPSQTMTVSCSQ